MEPAIGYAAIVAFFSAGAAWGAVKAGLNGTKGRVESLTDQITQHIKDESDNDRVTHERIASVETKIDFIVKRIQ